MKPVLCRKKSTTIRPVTTWFKTTEETIFDPVDFSEWGLMDEGLESSHPATPETTCSNTTTTKLECLCSLPKIDRTLEENITLLKFKEMFLYIQQERAYKCPFAEMISIDVLSSNFKETDPTEVFLLEKENFLSELENVL